jgi:glutamine---fructose-6-phosphate transaminase (isomerizing)
MYHIEKEIAEQPDVIQRLITEEAENAVKIARAIREFNPQFVMIAARGTSDNAARYAEYLMGIVAKLPVALANPSIHTLYGSQPNMSKALVIGISQSGKSADVDQVVKDARAQGALTLNITNDPDSPMAHSAEHHLWLRCGEEISIAATKTYTAQLTAIALLTTTLLQDASMQSGLNALPGYMRETLKLSENVAAWVQRYRYMERIAAIGRGYNYCTAFEIALKIKELCYVTGEEYSEADFRHGPIAMIAPGFPVLVIAPSGAPQALLVDLLQNLKERRAECMVISDKEEVCKYGTVSMALPDNLPEWLSPMCAVVPGQMFAMHLALAMGHSVDKPQGLNKVTITR